jgi:RNA polymerase sigma factor (sigma-70 family)
MKDTRHEAIKRVERIVYHLHRQGHATGMPPHEAVAEGLLGLAESDARYDEGRGANRWTFASARIRGAVIDAARREAKAWSPLGVEGAAPSRRPVAGVGTTEVWPARHPEDEAFHLPVNRPLETRTFESRIAAREMARLLGRCLRILPPRRRHMVLECGIKNRPVREAGREIGLSRGQATRFLHQGLKQIRELLTADGYSLQDFL